MALYRHTSTGFLGEFASNPGAGYAAISTMPTDTIANRVAWWRGLDTFGQTSSWHPSEYRSAQDPSEATISIQFTQEAALISADPDGTVTNPRDPGNTYYLGASTEVRVYRGLTDVTVSEGWTLTKVEEGCTSSLTQTGGLYTLKITDIPLVATQSGFVRVTATRTGSGTFVKDFRFLKVFQGQDGVNGSSGLVIDLDNENQTVAAQKDGTWISGTTATTTARLYLGATQLTSGITWSVLSATSGITYSQTNNTSSFTVTVTNMTAALVTGSITLRAVYNGVNYDQVFSISKANAGLDGTPATVFWLDTSASAIAKAKTGAYNPTSITLNAYSQTGTGAVLAYTGRFRVETQATLNGAWTARYNSLGNEASASYTIPASIVAVRVILFQAGGTTTLLDQETLPVVADGQDGLQGTRGSRQIVLSGTSWTDAAAWNGIIAQFGGTTPVLSDLVTIANAGTGFSVSKFYSGGVFDGDWTEPTAYINGNLLVTGTVGANQIAANAITAGKIAAGAVTLTNLTFTPVQSTNVVASINASAEGLQIAGSRIRIDGAVTFGSGYDPSTKLSAGGAATDINNNTTTINGNKITTGSLSADKIGAGTITGQAIILSGANAVLRSSNFALGTGFRISGDGNAFFYGSAVSGSARSTNWNGTISGTTGQPTAGTGTQGWCIDSAGNAEFNTVMVRTRNIDAGAVSKSYQGSNTVTGSVTANQAITVFSQTITSSFGQLGDVILLLNVSAVSPNLPQEVLRLDCQIVSNDGFSQTVTGRATPVPAGSPSLYAVVPMSYVHKANGSTSRTYTFYIYFSGNATNSSITRNYSAAAILLQR